jgi:hypothetical protein
MNKRIDLIGTCQLLAETAGEGAAKKVPTLSLNAYGGGPMKVDGWSEPVIVDGAGVTYACEGLPVYATHAESLDNLIGQTTSVSCDASGRITATANITASPESSPQAKRLLDHGANGFKWQVSVGMKVLAMQYVSARNTEKVNGRVCAGPVYIARRTVLFHLAVVPLGADTGTAVKIAAERGQESNTMITFENWIEAQGLQATTLSEAEQPVLMAAYDALAKAGKLPEAKAVPANKIEAGFTVDLEASRKAIAEESRRMAAIEAVFAGKHAASQESLLKIKADAIEAGWPADQTRNAVELADIRAERAFTVHASTHALPDGVTKSKVIEAAMCLSGGLNAEKAYGEKVLEAADSHYRRLGLQQALLMAAADNGYNVRPGEGIHQGNLGAILRAAWSTAEISGILSNVGNKFKLEQYMFVERAWSEIAARRNVKDFKTITSYRLLGGGGYQQLGPGGQIQHGTLEEQSFTNKADTYAEMLAITRTDIINDDLSALSGNAGKLGRDSALKINEVFWTEFLDNSTFFASGNSNVSASSALAIAGLTKTVTVFLKLKDASTKAADRKFVGSTPRTLLVPVDLQVTGDQLYTDLTVNEAATAGSPTPNGNPHRGKYKVVSSRYLSDSTIPGYSATSYYLLADPRDVATIEIAFLNGQETPTIETADADFNTLGIQMRGYHDFGVNLQDPKGGVRANA